MLHAASMVGGDDKTGAGEPVPRRKGASRPAARPSKKSDSTTGVQSVSRAFGILELFEERRPSLTTTEIATLTGLNRATAHRFCQTLLNLGYLEEVYPRAFRPGLKAVSLAQAALSSHELPDLALPYLRDLRERTGETVNMARLDAPDIIYVARLLNDDLLALRLFVGSRLPAYATSMGRAMLAFLEEAEVEAMLDGIDLERLTEHTIVDRRRLVAELRRIRNRGYAVNDQELVENICGIAAPVFGVSGRPVAAINVSVTRQLAAAESDDLAQHVTEAARAVSELAQQLSVDVA
jgi:IclR family transcriptional regulator, pca regulon regulatory protein